MLLIVKSLSSAHWHFYFLVFSMKIFRIQIYLLKLSNYKYEINMKMLLGDVSPIAVRKWLVGIYAVGIIIIAYSGVTNNIKSDY